MNKIGNVVLYLFKLMREAGFSLGTSEFEAVLKAVRHGYGWESLEDLKRICKRIWLTGKLEESEFDYYFDLGIAQIKVIDKDSLTESEKSDNKERDNLGGNKKDANIPKEIKDQIQQSHQKFSQETSDPIAARRAIAQGLGIDKEEKGSNHKSRFYTLDYLPLRRRELQRQWAHLRRMEKKRDKRKINLGATIQGICKNGFFIEPIWEYDRKNVSELILFIDRGGSMVAFEELGQRLAETAQRAGYLKNVRVYYFYNVPGEKLFLDIIHTKSISSRKIMQEADWNRTSLIIFSDAGAAKGNDNPRRVGNTRRFLRYQVAPYIRHAIWLNPMPEKRWEKTSAKRMESYISMYAVDKVNIEKAMQELSSLKPTIT